MFSPNEFNSGQKKNKKPAVYKNFTRKFPGPAGFSPDLAPGEVEKLVSEENGLRGISNNGILLGSTYSNILLSKPCYQRLIQDYGLNELNNPLNHLTLQMVSKAFIRKGKKDMKIPFLGLLVSSLSVEHGILLKLMDPTHEVNAVVHHDIWNEINADVEINSAIALTQVPVIASCTTRPPITLFISKKNVLTLYTETKEGEANVKTFNSVPEIDLKKTCGEWLTQMGVNPSGKGTPVRSFLTPERQQAQDSENGKLWSSNDDFFKDLNFMVEDFESSSESWGNSCAKSENFTPKRPKIDLESRGSKSTVSAKEKNVEHRGSDLPRKESEIFDLMVESECQVLTQSEKLMVEEVLSGISFDEFDS